MYGGGRGKTILGVPRRGNCFGSLASEANGRVVKRLEHGFNEAVELILPDLFGAGIFPQLRPWLLPAGPRLQRGFLEKQLLQIVRRIEIGLVAGRYENGMYFLSLQRGKVNVSEIWERSEGSETGGTDPLGLVPLH